MNQHLETILNFIQRSKELSDEARKDLLKDIQKADGEMEDKNHELQIETALERVRSVAMNMNTPDDLLNICKALFKELQRLEFVELRNAIIHTYLEGKNYFIDYDYSDFNNGHISKIPYSGNRIIEKFVQDIRRSRDAFTEIIITGNDLKQWQSFRDANNEVADERLSKTSALYYYMYSIGEASIGISTFDPVPAGKQEVLKRFRNVFGLAYKRYVDITNAEAQTREAKIEASLERMRAVAMSMNKPDDLLNICETMYREFNSFGFAEMRNAMINIHNDENKTFVNYDYSDTIGRSINHLRYDIHPVIEKQIMQMRSATDAFSETVFEGEDLANWKKFRKDVGEKDDPRIDKAVALYYYFYSIGTGSIGISSFAPVKEKKLEVLKRFRNVFDLSYKRYTDIALAESQAREAQIELALERVRARTMAMQKSDELSDTAYVLFQQFKELGESPFQITIGIINESESLVKFNITGADGTGAKISRSFNMAIDEPSLIQKFIKAWKENRKSCVIELAGKELTDWVAYRNLISGIIDNNDYTNARRYIAAGFFTKGLISISTLDPINTETCLLLERFANVFDQTYTRFLDLQKAEAYAEKAHIEEQKLREEKKRSDSLLLNILPEEIANELKQFGKSYARKHEEVTILFSDIKGFSTISENLSADELVTQLDECFRAFDKIVEKHGLEKIKTVGDAYICACGLPTPVTDNATKTVRAAIDMLDFLKGFNSSKKVQDLPAFEFRIGIHTGPVVTGVVGLKKFTYDIWGDAVNMAARMEQHGEAGKINVSGNTYRLIKDKFTCTPRGKILAKNKGEVDMYFVDCV